MIFVRLLGDQPNDVKNMQRSIFDAELLVNLDLFAFSWEKLRNMASAAEDDEVCEEEENTVDEDGSSATLKEGWFLQVILKCSW